MAQLTDTTILGDLTVTGNSNIQGALALSNDISPTALAANTDNWNPTGLSSATVIRMSSSAAYNLTGISGGVDGRILVLINIGSFVITLKHDATSTAANRFYLPGNADLPVPVSGVLSLCYDFISLRWRVLDSFGSAIPVAGASTQILQYTASGQAKWITVSGDVTIADGGAITIGSDKVSIAKRYKPVQAKGSVSGAQTFDLTTYSCITITSGGNITVDLTGSYTASKLYATKLVITNGGNYTWGWAAKFRFAGGTPPVLTSNGTDTFILSVNDGGTTCDVSSDLTDKKAA